MISQSPHRRVFSWFLPAVCAASAFAILTPVFAQSPSSPVKLDDDAARQARVAKLVSQMTLEEKVSQMQNHAAAIPRLGIPAYDYWSEALHGVARSGDATLFPQAIGLASTWDTDLMHQVATTISVEARAKYNQAIRQDIHDIYYGLTLWSPNINIFRDPRWGRGQETYGEDPFLTSRLGVAFVSGLQGDDTTYLRAISTPKHFAVHSGPESERHRFNVNVSPHDLEDTYLPAFRAAVTEAHAQSLMCAYNAVDGAPACANPPLLEQILRKDWGFDGFVTSDCAAITDVADGHKFAPDLEHASVLAVRAGTDTSCGTEYATLTKAVQDGLIAEGELDVSVRRLFLGRFRLGMFDPAGSFPYASLPFSEVDSAAHRRLALQAARESIVLLKNQDHLLPLTEDIKTIAVIGPNAAALAALEGNYNAVSSHAVTPLEGLRTALATHTRVLYAQGSPYVDGLPLPVPETIFRTAPGSQEAGLHAEYFTGTTLSGTPVASRTDLQIDFDWAGASPVKNLDPKSFSVRWTGTITPPVAGDYTFSLPLEDCYPCTNSESYTILLNGKVVATQTRSRTNATFTAHFADTTPQTFRLDYTHDGDLAGAGLTLKWIPPAAALRDEAIKAAQASDIVVAFVGLSPQLEGEEMPIKVAGFAGGDRTNIDLPAPQQQLLEALAQTGKPLVVVLMNGSALAVRWAKQHAAAILEAWYPGEEGGTAIAQTLLGENNPAGRLPVTFYRSVDQLPPFDDYSMQGRTYRYLAVEPVFAFGAGLSYTDFTYSGTHLAAKTIKAGDPAVISTTVTNTGKVAGDEVVEVYLTPPNSPTAPILSLVAFQRIHLAAGESKDVTLTIKPRQLSLVDVHGKRAIVAGRYSLNIGGKQPLMREPGIPLEITGTLALPQ